MLRQSNIAMRNGPFEVDFPYLNWGYSSQRAVSLPEGKWPFERSKRSQKGHVLK